MVVAELGVDVAEAGNLRRISRHSRGHYHGVVLVPRAAGGGGATPQIDAGHRVLHKPDMTREQPSFVPHNGGWVRVLEGDVQKRWLEDMGR